ncbi:DedA family protein [Methanobacterium sp. BAmetb5]|uniref:DedA family protein n=1 Tax=Methanobacterium sp. BAmetb5 TaxID=2025351 RepID=UPI000E913C42|nr:VTT domain-containing protein [Methanobacterium sp. BAmetb5]AXV40706.1 MAG: membrane-associated protein [Methanobacterium sp. BAmetb5]
MFSEIINITESFIVANVSWAVFIGCILEQIIVPIPASLIVLSSTFLLLKGTSFSLAAVGTLLVKVVLPASLGITVGSFVYYTLAYKLGEPFIKRTSKYLGVSVEDVKEVEIKFKKSRYDDIFMFLARCFPVIPSIAINLFCGVIKYDLKKYIITTFLGSAVQIFGWGMLAWFSGNIYLALEDQVSFIGNLVTGIIMVVVIGFIVLKRREKKLKMEE